MSEAEPSVFALVGQLSAARQHYLTLTQEQARLFRRARLQEATALGPPLAHAAKEVRRLERELAARQLELFATKEG